MATMQKHWVWVGKNATMTLEPQLIAFEKKEKKKKKSRHLRRLFGYRGYRADQPSKHETLATFYLVRRAVLDAHAYAMYPCVIPM